MLEFILPAENKGGGGGKCEAGGSPPMECSRGRDNWVPWRGWGLEAAAGVFEDVVGVAVPSWT